MLRALRRSAAALRRRVLPRQIDWKAAFDEPIAAATLVDVGAAHGTPELYALAPSAELVLVEPLVEYEPDLRAVLAERPGTWVAAAAGAAEGTVTLQVPSGAPTKASIHRRSPRTALGADSAVREVPLQRLETILRDTGARPPFGVKVDTEGHELEVLRGIGAAVDDIDFLIAEVSVKERFVGGYTFDEFLEATRALGFTTTAVLSANADRHGVVRYTDLLFERT